MENTKRGREDANARKFIEISGYEIWTDPRNWIVRRGKGTPHYFSKIEDAIMFVALQEEKGIDSNSLMEIAGNISRIHSELRKALVQSVAASGEEFRSKAGNPAE